MNKVTSALLCAALMLSLACPARAAPQVSEAETAGIYLRELGVLVGDQNGDLRLGDGLTRAHLATILTRVQGNPNHVQADQAYYIGQCQFSDVPEWARLYVGYCYANGLMAGYGGEVFGADDGVTPQAACTVVLRYLDLQKITWDYSTACQTALELGLVTVEAAAKAEITRGDLAVMLYRTLTWSSFHEPANSTDASVSISSYKGTILEVGTRSGLIVSPSEEVKELVSSNPDVITVEQVSGNWVAVAKSPGSARIYAVTDDGEQGHLVISVSGNAGSLLDSETGTDYAANLEIRGEILVLVNQVRLEHGLSAAPADQSLMEAAQDYATRRNTWHDSQEECELVLAHGYPHGFSCNLTVFTGVPLEKVAQTAVDNWCNSPGHLQAMIDPKADSLGVGVERYEGVTYCYLFVGMSGTINPYA